MSNIWQLLSAERGLDLERTRWRFTVPVNLVTPGSCQECGRGSWVARSKSEVPWLTRGPRRFTDMDTDGIFRECPRVYHLILHASEKR